MKLVEPHTEADAAALLLQLLIGFGNLCGPALFRFAGGVAHHLNEYAVIVGDTSRARKGTSWAEVERFLGKVDQGWSEHCVTSGLSTGEGLIWHVRDPQRDEDPAEDSARPQRPRRRGRDRQTAHGARGRIRCGSEGSDARRGDALASVARGLGRQDAAHAR